MDFMDRNAGIAERDESLRSLELPGARVAYYERGAGTPLILVHGMFGDHLDWAPVLEPLSECHRVISIDLPGFGDSSKSIQEYTPEFFVGVMNAFLCALDLKGAILVGNSFGGLLSSLLIAVHPERLSGLVLVSSAGMREYSQQEQALASQHFSESNLLLMRPEYVEPLFAMNFAQVTEARAAYLERQRGKLAHQDYKVYAHVLAECAVMAFAHPVVPLLSEVKLPILLLWGDRDPVFPVELAQAALPFLLHARLTVIEGASHMPQMDQPLAFVKELAEFISQCGASQGV